jgi:HTH-type transcriptional regulator/antitoxin MqsA
MGQFTSRQREAVVYPKKCAECGGEVGVSMASIPFEIRGETIEVGGIMHGLCSGCGEVYLTLDATEALQKEAIRLAKQAKGLLSPDEIRSLRRSLGLSQVAFEGLLGVGPKTVVRWEKGTVFQTATADRLMRLVGVMPALSGLLASEALYRPARPVRSGVKRHTSRP